jgi:pyruvate kinase
MRRTKIVCTIGPASQEPETLERLVEAGMDVARLNFSHGTHEGHARALRTIRQIEQRRRGRPIAVLQDLAGIKLRIGEIAGGSVLLETGAPFTLTTQRVTGDAGKVSLEYPDLPRAVRPGDRIFLADGDLELLVVETTPEEIRCRVIVGGLLSSRKGIHLPGRSIDAPALTEKDRADLEFGISQGVDFVALSFVRTAADVTQARRFLQERHAAIPLIAKIEKHEALDNLDTILPLVDGIMVARGDLGVETPLEHVPLLQKMLLARSNRVGIPAITATQMLRSMVENPRPTRAEVTDVANAIFDGTDAVMLSEETASGRYPVEAVSMMARIAQDAEGGFPFAARAARAEEPAVQDPADAIADAACKLARDIKASAIVACTQSGSSARRIARHRPSQPVLALTPLLSTWRSLALVWGVVAVQIGVPGSTDEAMERVPAVAVETGLVRRGDRIVITAGIPMGVSGSTNSIRTAIA